MECEIQRYTVGQFLQHRCGIWDANFALFPSYLYLTHMVPCWRTLGHTCIQYDLGEILGHIWYQPYDLDEILGLTRVRTARSRWNSRTYVSLRTVRSGRNSRTCILWRLAEMHTYEVISVSLNNPGARFPCHEYFITVWLSFLVPLSGPQVITLYQINWLVRINSDLPDETCIVNPFSNPSQPY